MANEDKKKALDAAIAKLEKDFGKGTVMKLGDPGAQVAVETIPTGSLSLDLALGLGGVPRGRIVEVYGPESSGKTTVALHMIAEVQKRGGIAGFIDAEHALDPTYAKNIGVDIDELYISQPDSGDQALEITETMVRSGALDIIVVDSVAALVPKQEIEGDMGDSHVGLQARLMSQALRKLTPVISKSNCVVIFINQLREKVGVMFGNPETTTGGRALKFYASVRMDVRRIETLKQSGEMVGNRTRVKVVKNKIAPPFKEAEFVIMFGKGISKEGDILDLAVGLNLVSKSGSWFAYNGEKIGQGRENAKKYLSEHPEVLGGTGRENPCSLSYWHRGTGRRRDRRRVRMVITGIEPINKTKCQVYLDGEPVFPLYKGEILRYQLKPEMELEEETYQIIRCEIVLKRVKLRAMHLLTDMGQNRSAASDKALKRWLFRRDCKRSGCLCEIFWIYQRSGVMQWSFINSRKERKSRKEIYASLCQKGISRERIEKAMEEEYQYEDSKEAIRTLLRKKGYDAEKADYEEKHKVMAYLVRKGFSYEEVRSAMRLDEW